jgi:phosphoribosyl 1,2-cyclic phosphate phosphodiesterase
MRLTLLGTGTSMGVPQIGCDCRICRSEDPRDQRTRTSALVEVGNTTILIDTPPELRLQLLRSRVHRIDAVLYTHFHADHVNGIDDLRSFSIKQHAPLPLYGPAETTEHLAHSFNYIFDRRIVPVDGTSKPSLTLHPLEPDTAASIAGVEVLPLRFEHGRATVYGYRIGDVAYLTDVKSVSEANRQQLRGLKLLVLNALWWREHPTHLSFADAIEVAHAVGAERTYLTHLTHETGHRELLAKLPAGVEPGHDGLVLEIF